MMNIEDGYNKNSDIDNWVYYGHHSHMLGDLDIDNWIYYGYPTWRAVACMFGTDLCPNNMWQAYSWCHSFFPEGEVFYTMGIAAICWAIWTCRNRATFEFIPLKSPFECTFSTCALLCYWAGLMKQ